MKTRRRRARASWDSGWSGDDAHDYQYEDEPAGATVVVHQDEEPPLLYVQRDGRLFVIPRKRTIGF